MTPPLVAVGGALANKPSSGGEAWVRMSWVRGFQRLGLDVVFVEQIGREHTSAEAIAYFQRTASAFGVDAALIDEAGETVAGLDGADLAERLADAAALVNISGNVAVPALLRAVRRRVYVDIDPGFTQIWTAQGSDAARLEGHDAYFTVGEDIGTPGCPIPTLGIDWCPLPPPVVLEDWPVVPVPDGAAFTTVATWRNPFGGLYWEGADLPMKHREWRRVIDLPRRVPSKAFEAALHIWPGDHADRDALVEHGWRLRDPVEAAGDHERFRTYVQASAAEFSVANGAYVALRSGWFSDRTVRYLASGRPAVVQDTGSRYPAREGLLAFSTLDEAVAGAEAITADPAAHRAAARALAEEHFDSDKVLPRVLDAL